MDAAALARRIESTPYCASLGIRIEHADATGARLRVPYADGNSNPGQALHGGVTASLIDIAGGVAARAALGDPAALAYGTLDLSVDYLAAAIGEEIVAGAEVLRRGKEIVYSAVDVRTAAGKRVAFGLVTVRGVDPAALPRAAERQRLAHAAPPAAAPQRIAGANAFVRAPYMSRLGITVDHAHDAAASLVLPYAAAIADDAGAAHEGAVAALIDSAGALASWSITGLDMRFKASTVGIHVSYHGRASGEDLVAEGRTLRRDNEIFLNQVSVAGRRTGAVVATGAVTYRIVMP